MSLYTSLTRLGASYGHDMHTCSHVLVLQGRSIPSFWTGYINTHCALWKYFLTINKLISCKPVHNLLSQNFCWWSAKLEWLLYVCCCYAYRSLKFLCHCLFNYCSKVKSAAYKCIVMEYTCPVWYLHTAKNINSLEHVQYQAAQWVSDSRWIHLFIARPSPQTNV